MDFIVWLIVGGLVGWIAAMIMGTNTQQHTIPYIVVGIAGALTGGWLVGPLLGAGSPNEGATFMSFIVSLAGVALLLAIPRLLQHSSAN